MTRIDWKDRIVVDAEIHHADPCISGTRIPMIIIVGSIADGLTVEEVLAADPQLEAEDVRAALEVVELVLAWVRSGRRLFAWLAAESLRRRFAWSACRTSELACSMAPLGAIA